MPYDGHIHIKTVGRNQRGLMAGFRRAGVKGGIIMSLPPAGFRDTWPTLPDVERLKEVIAWCQGNSTLYPFFWINPLAEDAETQVDLAVKEGVMGFKVICDRFYPGDERAIAVFKKIAAARKPILFHSGILFDGKPSSKYNRPAEFEALLEVKGLRFSMAHLGWPWCDEMIAVTGKFLNAPESATELFIDTTPGTPPVYRRDALTKLFKTGYAIENRVFFGSDSIADPYDGDVVRQWIERDQGILTELGLGQEMIDAVFEHNVKRFVTESLRS